MKIIITEKTDKNAAAGRAPIPVHSGAGAALAPGVSHGRCADVPALRGRGAGECNHDEGVQA